MNERVNRILCHECGGLGHVRHDQKLGHGHDGIPCRTCREEGGRVTIKQFRGSRGICQWSSFMFALERDQQSDDPAERCKTTFRILKDRYTGRSTGSTFGLTYDRTTGRLNEDVGGGGFKDETTTDKPDF